MTIGIIAEYNPFHNGHLYQINKIKELYPESTLILVTNNFFTQRGDISIINKWDKAKIALENNIDLIVELPFVFATQSADIFAKGAVEILNHLKVDKLVFGSETNDINLLKNISKALLNENNIKKYLDLGYSYPKALNLFLEENYKFTLKNPNDILGVSYIKEIIKLNSSIEPICIKRINNYHSTKLENISSATALRKALKENMNITNYIPKNIEKYINKHFTDEIFAYLKYKIISENDLQKYQTVDEGIEYRLKKYIYKSNTLDEFINKVKTKRYTYNKIKRMIIHIICSFTKEEAKNLKTEYIRIINFNNKGQEYLNKIKKECTIPIISKYKKFKNLDIEIRSTMIYDTITNQNFTELEYKNHIKK